MLLGSLAHLKGINFLSLFKDIPFHFFAKLLVPVILVLLCVAVVVAVGFVVRLRRGPRF